ncbi:MAG TPA: glycosyltransferase family 9 protein [Sediminibacterium sp.]|nr:glycosyltransferase family 9 protein [Sediminibacterium sp.]
MKFLVIRFSSIGDIVLTSPVLRCLKQQVPDAEIHYLTKMQFAALVEHSPYIDKVQVLGYSWELMIHQLKAEHYDAVIDLHHNLRTWRIKSALGVQQTHSFPKLNLQKWLLTAFKINRLPELHIVDRYLAAVAGFGVKNDGKGLEYFLPEQNSLLETDIPLPHRFGYIGIVIGAALATKQLPMHKLQELCAGIQHPLILLGGPEDREAGDRIAAVNPVKIYNACGKFSLHESARLVQRARIIITHDTGLMHIAAAFHKPVISIWGNTVPAFGMTPYYGNEKVWQQMLEVPGLSCRPCSKIGYRSCPKKHFRCMEQQDLTQVFQALKEQVHAQVTI